MTHQPSTCNLDGFVLFRVSLNYNMSSLINFPEQTTDLNEYHSTLSYSLPHSTLETEQLTSCKDYTLAEHNYQSYRQLSHWPLLMTRWQYNYLMIWLYPWFQTKPCTLKSTQWHVHDRQIRCNDDSACHAIYHSIVTISSQTYNPCHRGSKY